MPRRAPTKSYLEHIQDNITYDPTTGALTANGESCINLTTTGYPVIYIRLRGRRKYMSASKVAWYLHYGEWTLRLIRHHNQDRLDLRIDNLCLSDEHDTPRVSRQKYRSGSSNYKGVSFSQRDKVWVARCTKNSRQYWCGQYQSEEEAALAYNAKAKELYGALAVLNEVAS